MISAPGRITAAQVGLHSGAATFSYPIQVPPGRNGFQPNLNLNYNSARLDEMKSKWDVGSWVGIGWELNMGRISYDPIKDKHYLEINGVSFELYASDGTMLGTESLILMPWSNDQINRIFEPYRPVTGYVDYWSDLSTGSVYCYGSVLDNAPSDPTTVPPM